MLSPIPKGDLIVIGKSNRGNKHQRQLAVYRYRRAIWHFCQRDTADFLADGIFEDDGEAVVGGVGAGTFADLVLSQVLARRSCRGRSVCPRDWGRRRW